MQRIHGVLEELSHALHYRCASMAWRGVALSATIPWVPCPRPYLSSGHVSRVGWGS